MVDPTAREPARTVDPQAIARAERELSRLHEQAVDERAVLARLQQAVADEVSHLDDARAAHLVEANERLVLETLRAQGDADACARTLEEVSRSAGLDALTALPNRVLLLDRFAQSIANARLHHTGLALLFIDLDNFKQINDTLGHAIGDQVLKLAGERLANGVRDVDTVSRHGGDEFLVLLSEISDAADAVQIADKLIAALAVPGRVGEHVLRLTASIGISLYPDDGEDAQSLIDQADAAMYSAKRLGGGSVVFKDDPSAGERSRRSPGFASQPTLVQYDLALVDHERRNGQLREANGRLILTAIDAQQLRAVAVQAERRQREFMALLAHELRNPLSSIRLAASLCVDGSPRDAAEMLTTIDREVTHMARLISDLLDVSRVSTGKLRLERQMVDMSKIIGEAVETCRPAMDVRLQAFVVQVPTTVLPVYGDAVRLAQVLGNLLDNASKYTPAGGVIGLMVEVVEDEIVMTVSDDGIGISAEALPEVFEPFMQDTRAIAFNGLGLGIGLTLVRELVESHGGGVVARSRGAGLGSEFVVTLPLSTP